MVTLARSGRKFRNCPWWAARNVSGERSDFSMSERQTLPVVPLRGAVVFPGVTVPISVGRASTLRAVEEAAKHNQRLFAVAQRENVDKPKGEHLYAMGVVARIVHMQRTP